MIAGGDHKVLLLKANRGLPTSTRSPLERSRTARGTVVHSRRENSAIPSVSHKRPPLLADEGPVIGSAAASIVDAVRAKRSVPRSSNRRLTRLSASGSSKSSRCSGRREAHTCCYKREPKSSTTISRTSSAVGTHSFTLRPLNPRLLDALHVAHKVGLDGAPGAIDFTWMPNGASSRGMLSLHPSSAHFVAW